LARAAWVRTVTALWTLEARTGMVDNDMFVMCMVTYSLLF